MSVCPVGERDRQRLYMASVLWMRWSGRERGGERGNNRNVDIDNKNVIKFKGSVIHEPRDPSKKW